MKLTHIISVVTVALFTSMATAHGNDDHSKKPIVSAVIKEQKDWGIAGEAKDAKRTIAVSMSDTMKFTPAKIDVKQGETVKINITNNGKIMHEFVIGTKKELDAHAAVMLKNPGMEHDEPYMAHVAPGKTGSIVWTFNRAGDFDFACLIAGHYQAGMVGSITVAGVEMTVGEVRKIDRETGKITLKHEDIKNLDMPGMTMVFQVTDKTMLDKVQVGDRIKFSADKQQGKFVVTDIKRDDKK
jgi:uncharacterized cupredoxin-like copper-binding protein